MKNILKVSLAKAGIYATIVTVILASWLDYSAYRNCIKYPSLNFSVIGAVAIYVILELLNFIGIGIFQLIKNSISYVAQPEAQTSEETKTAEEK